MLTPQLLEFKHLQLFKEAFTEFPPEISEHTFTNLFVWRKSRPLSFLRLDGSLVVLAPDGNGQYLLFGPPIGDLSLHEALDALGDLITGAIRIPASFLATLGDSYAVHADRDNSDYVYQVEDMANLAGRQYAKKRNLVKQCLAKYNCEYEPLTESLIPECIALQDKWCEVRSCDLDPGLCAEYSAINALFKHFFEMDVIGGAVRVDGTIQAFAVGEKLRPGTAVCHFEKAMPDFIGLGQVINQWFAKHGLMEFEFINREQDLGIAGLRQAKQSYHPHHLVEKHRVLSHEKEKTTPDLKNFSCEMFS